MKKITLILIILFSFIAMESCTNDENDEKIDIIIPTDSTKITQSVRIIAI
ncbi:MAG: hypothetical protein R3243_00080 [Arenibacter latericius]|nr:hypothetical protein [Arenibacter latericius]